MNHPFSAEHLEILQSQCVTLVEDPDTTSINKQKTYTNYTLVVAINQYIATATELQSINLNLIRNGISNASAIDSATIERMMDFMTVNGKGSLIYYTDLTEQLFTQEVNNALDSKKNVITITLIVDPIIILILLMLFIPFIFKVQANLLKIYMHLCQFKDVDIKKWLEQCNDSASDIKASTVKMKKIYESESFEIIINRDAEKEKAEDKSEKPSKKESIVDGKEEKPDQDLTQNSTMKSTESPLANAVSEESMAMNQSKEEAVTDRKEKMFSRMTKDKTKTYLLSLLAFTIYIGIFKTADALVFSDLCTQSDNRAYYFLTVVNREKYHAMGRFFFREELLSNSPQTYSNCKF